MSLFKVDWTNASGDSFTTMVLANNKADAMVIGIPGSTQCEESSEFPLGIRPPAGFTDVKVHLMPGFTLPTQKEQLLGYLDYFSNLASEIAGDIHCPATSS